jgi:hypothetical protein
MKYKIVEKNNIRAVHSVGYYGEAGKQKAQNRIDTGECHRYWSNKGVDFIVVEDN